MGLATRGRGADLVSFWPRQMMGSWAERLVVPFMFVLLLVFLPHWMPGRRRSLGAANGQFMLFRRVAYQTIGGHEAVRAHLVDDVALARTARAGGLRVLNRNGAPWVSCRMYDDAAGVWEGFSKNLRAGFEGSTASFVVFHGVEFVWGLWPFLLLAAVPFLPAGAGAGVAPLAAAHALLVLGMRLAIARSCRHRLADVLLHPLAQAAVFAIAANSWRVYAAKRVAWKGRFYPGN
jgi:chlorobactene glucosyltransferase